jgi:hypothetical protein
MPMRWRPFVHTLTGLFALVLSACSLGPAETVVFYEGRFQATKPASWAMLDELNDAADLQMGNQLKEAYCLILTESKQDFAEDMTLAAFSTRTRSDLIDSLTDVQSSGPQQISSNGNPAIRYDFTGTIDSVRIRYWHIVVDTGEDFHQVVLWSLPSKFEGNREDFESVLASLKQI